MTMQVYNMMYFSVVGTMENTENVTKMCGAGTNLCVAYDNGDIKVLYTKLKLYYQNYNYYIIIVYMSTYMCAVIN